MADSYTVLWSQDRCRLLRRHGETGERLDLLFGGPHGSEPCFSRFGVQPGDYIYPLHISDCVLHILGRMKVKRLLSLEEFIAERPRMLVGCEEPGWPYGTLRNWLERHPEKRYLAWTCTDEVVLGEEGTPIRFDVPVPAAVLERLRFRSRRGERGIKYVEDGRLKSAISLQGGVYRLSEESARDFESLLLTAERKVATKSGQSPRRGQPGQTQSLWP